MATAARPTPAERKLLKRSALTRKRMLVGAGVVVLVLLVFAVLDITPSLRHLDTTVLSGSKAGNYSAIVDTLAAEAEKRKGTIVNENSPGSAARVLPRSISGSGTGTEAISALE